MVRFSVSRLLYFLTGKLPELLPSPWSSQPVLPPGTLLSSAVSSLANMKAVVHSIVSTCASKPDHLCCQERGAESFHAVTWVSQLDALSQADQLVLITNIIILINLICQAATTGVLQGERDWLGSWC